MSPNSLIFLVIIGIWAAYLSKYLVRRRDHLATARSMDRFSESMRVLQRTPASRTDLAPARPMSFAVGPEKLARPQVTVKSGHPAEVADEEFTDDPAAYRRFSRGTRGVALIVAVVFVPVLLVLAALSIAPWWGMGVAAANVGAAFLWLRQAVQEDIAFKRASRPAAVPTRATAPAPARSPLAARPARPARPVETEEQRRDRKARELAVGMLGGELPPEVTVRRAETAALAAPIETELPVAAPAATAVAEPTAQELAPSEPVRPEPALPQVDEDDIPLTWDPRPVPRPTYAMKARAEHPQPQPLAAPEPEPIPAVSFEDDGLQAYGSRTAAG